MSKQFFMQKALSLAAEAAAEGEIPVGALVVKDGEIIGVGRNMREKHCDPSSHAEIEALRVAAERLGDWRLNGCDIYVTLEPCPMCAGAIINSRISRVYFGAYDSRAGSFGSRCDLTQFGYEALPEIHGGLSENECKKILSDFFKDKR